MTKEECIKKALQTGMKQFGEYEIEKLEVGKAKNTAHYYLFGFLIVYYSAGGTDPLPIRLHLANRNKGPGNEFDVIVEETTVTESQINQLNSQKLNSHQKKLFQERVKELEKTINDCLKKII